MEINNINEAGFYPNMSEKTYHADPCPTPSLSHSLIEPLVNQSPLHAAYKHPKLYSQMTHHELKTFGNPTAAMIKGSILHKMILGKGAEIAVLNHKDYRTKAAKDDYDKALSDGKLPIKEKEYKELLICVEVARSRIKNHPACKGFLSQGQSEVVIAWKEDNIWCRSMIDFIPDDLNEPIFDIKFTEQSASPHDWQKRLINIYKTQDVFYNRGLKKLGSPRDKPMRFIVVEMQEPFAVMVFESHPSLQYVAECNVEKAVEQWKLCIKNNEWPGYGDQVACVSPPAWMLSNIEEQQTNNELPDYL